LAEQSLRLELSQDGGPIKVARAEYSYEDDRMDAPFVHPITHSTIYLSTDDWGSGSQVVIDIAGTCQSQPGTPPQVFTVFIAHWCGTIK
jgi:hypothetical protein